MDKDLIPILSEAMGHELPGNITLEGLREKIADHVNELIQNDFQKLVNILYRIDINEPRLKLLLKENPNSDAGKIIADLIIERQIQKIRSRREHRKDENISDEEKW